MSLHVALAGPINIGPLLPWLDSPSAAQHLSSDRVGTPVTQLAVGLLRRGIDTTVVALDGAVDSEVRLTGPGLRVCVGPYRPRRRARDYYRPERAFVARALAREAPALAHAHWTYEYALGALASGVPTLTTVHDWAPAVLRLYRDPYRTVRLAMALDVLARCRALTTVSPVMARRLARLGRRDVAVVPNAVEDELFAPRTHPLDTAAPRLVALANGFSVGKGVRTLLRAFPRVRAWNPACRLVLAGRDHEPDGPASAWARSRGLEVGVEFAGVVPHDEVPALLRAADALVHPSLEESFGVVLAEAMAQGLPVVGGARSGAVPWVLGGAGLLTDVSSPVRLAEAVISLLADPVRWERYARAGHDRAQEFRLSRVVDGYLDAYDRTLRGAATRSWSKSWAGRGLPS